MTDPDNIANRATGPVLDPDERPPSDAKRWAILLGICCGRVHCGRQHQSPGRSAERAAGCFGCDGARARQHQRRIAIGRTRGEVRRITDPRYAPHSCASVMISRLRLIAGQALSKSATSRVMFSARVP